LGSVKPEVVPQHVEQRGIAVDRHVVLTPVHPQDQAFDHGGPSKIMFTLYSFVYNSQGDSAPPDRLPFRISFNLRFSWYGRDGAAGRRVPQALDHNFIDRPHDPDLALGW